MVIATRGTGGVLTLTPFVSTTPQMNPAENPASSAAIGGGERGSFLIQGWTGIVMPHWDADKVDHLEPIGDDEAVEMTLRLSREEGVFAGISTGANVVGAHRLAERLGADAVIVTLAVDSGFKYMSVSPFSDLG